jgi:uncharacterized LabA/DUF88 family protein
MLHGMKVGVYIDGFNLYYGGIGLCGKKATGWRWLDLRSLATDLLGQSPSWQGAAIDRVVYCTAAISGTSDPQAQQRQDAYLKALVSSGCVDRIELGYFMENVRKAPLATADSKGRPVLVTSQPSWPCVVKDPSGKDVHNVTLMIQYAHREEKGSDVNLATHLLLDTLQSRIDAAIVISNDSDLALPITEAKTRIPVGVVNPSRNYTAGTLQGNASDGVGGHWWYKLTSADFTSHQLPDPCGGYSKPQGW